ncbi:MAG: hypothetical protein P8103_20880 [Candidatus Thiodiazotropha sp.]|jgi:hypothetical protein
MRQTLAKWLLSLHITSACPVSFDQAGQVYCFVLRKSWEMIFASFLPPFVFSCDPH